MAFNVNNRDAAMRALAFFTAREIKRAIEGAGETASPERVLDEFRQSQPCDSLKQEVADAIVQQAPKLFRQQ